ncbi:undecaprenyldiphospho-muramoylpentapeptide beta-N-acetylglucosaminyltransferase [Eubacteriales bacterium OttesenSCG-928-G02]|nr:undecaprenyldiphospho-muramoylpentapeptide beta-N-acetylglucosaminyltransferase [Eubacteriales bacterium OttesenSCG-928-G02]
MRVLISGGGTGGHINPALNIANEILEREKNSVIEFIGTAHGMEGTLIPKEGYKIHYVKVQGFKRKISLSNVKAAFRAVTSIAEAKKIIKKFKPDIVIGTGGYASWPTLKAAASLGIPTIIQEQNAFPGMTTKKLSKYVDKICISFASSEKYFPEKAKDKLILTGNPIKTNRLTKKEARKMLNIADNEVYILSTGGSLGADKLNTFVLDAMEINMKIPNLKHTHALGKSGWEKFIKIAEEKKLLDNKNYEILEYIYDMPVRQAAADIIVNRAGAMTTSEIAAIGGVATIFIPSPNVTDDHQYKNAIALKQEGAAEVFRESVVDGVILAKTIKDLINNPEKREELAKNMGKFGKPDATKIIVDEVYKLLK